MLKLSYRCGKYYAVKFNMEKFYVSNMCTCIYLQLSQFNRICKFVLTHMVFLNINPLPLLTDYDTNRNIAR